MPVRGDFFIAMNSHKSPFALILVLMFSLTACGGSQDLQNFFVEKAENPNYHSIVVPVSTVSEYWKDGDAAFTESGLKSINVLYFRVSEGNREMYSVELQAVKAILGHPDFKELMKFNVANGKAEIKYLGPDQTASEVVFLGYNPEQGFLLIRIAGKEINPVKLLPVFQQMQSDGLEKWVSL